MHKYSDEKLIEIYRGEYDSQRRKAFDYLYIRYAENLQNYFFFALRKDSEKAKDFSHDLFLKILESPEKFDLDQRFKPWLYRSASNMCKNEYRKQDVVEKYNSHIKHNSSEITQADNKNISLQKSIKKLSQEQRSLIVLRFKINLSIKEMAEIHQCPEGTIKSRLFYATRELSKYYKE